jgi:hypothetical protein
MAVRRVPSVFAVVYSIECVQHVCSMRMLSQALLFVICCAQAHYTDFLLAPVTGAGSSFVCVCRMLCAGAPTCDIVLVHLRICITYVVHLANWAARHRLCLLFLLGCHVECCCCHGLDVWPMDL